MDIISLVSIILQVVGGATVLLHLVAPLTRWKGDDKILQFLEGFLKLVSLNQKDGKLEIKIKN
jgi:hypothetical protein